MCQCGADVFFFWCIYARSRKQFTKFVITLFTSISRVSIIIFSKFLYRFLYCFQASAWASSGFVIPFRCLPLPHFLKHRAHFFSRLSHCIQQKFPGYFIFPCKSRVPLYTSAYFSSNSRLIFVHFHGFLTSFFSHFHHHRLASGQMKHIIHMVRHFCATPKHRQDAFDLRAVVTEP